MQIEKLKNLDDLNNNVKIEIESIQDTIIKLLSYLESGNKSKTYIMDNLNKIMENVRFCEDYNNHIENTLFEMIHKEDN